MQAGSQREKGILLRNKDQNYSRLLIGNSTSWKTMYQYLFWNKETINPERRNKDVSVNKSWENSLSADPCDKNIRGSCSGRVTTVTDENLDLHKEIKNTKYGENVGKYK